MAEPKKTAKTPESKFMEYFYANLQWWAFLVLLWVISFFTCGKVWDEVTTGITEFIFLIMGGGFLLVSAMDYFYDQWTNRPNPEVKK